LRFFTRRALSSFKASKMEEEEEEEEEELRLLKL
jgi:hypothetical protein